MEIRFSKKAYSHFPYWWQGKERRAYIIGRLEQEEASYEKTKEKIDNLYHVCVKQWIKENGSEKQEWQMNFRLFMRFLHRCLQAAKLKNYL